MFSAHGTVILSTSATARTLFLGFDATGVVLGTSAAGGGTASGYPHARTTDQARNTEACQGFFQFF